ncbi:uncharacterized protein BDW43DRAFT_265624 [Aspergillus alliaceus]|uniref:uncharacterized protein n=1 Tax=Petromyces alliaceus TaxID=209559 RepID=UPI0012A613DD|nr:uncharacterized protein BDW43DRAFT_265624 [Aspergillus alliaceus]KAB8237454.1 hypothetical protein BDW43DRAFT_265624 [Aspergillus alliaceus]
MEFVHSSRVASWPYEGLRRASVNSFSFGGANSHVVISVTYHYMRERALTGYHNTTFTESHLDSIFGFRRPSQRLG